MMRSLFHNQNVEVIAILIIILNITHYIKNTPNIISICLAEQSSSKKMVK